MTRVWQDEDGQQYAIAPTTDDEGVRGRRLLIADADGDLDVALEVLSKPPAPMQEITATWHRPVQPLLLQRFATDVVTELLDGVVRRGQTGWLQTNIAYALSWAGLEVSRWWGPEWPLVEDGAAGNAYSEPDADAVPFAWLGLALNTGDVEIDIYQDDAYFGLCFEPQARRVLTDNDPGYFRLHESLPLPIGRIEQVRVTIDTTTLDDPFSDIVLAEAVLMVGGQPVPLIAAENYGPNEWHRLDESVVILRDSAALKNLDWHPPRPV
ncbi:hypothetical protein APR04_004106 [Promicromonospora umidemergens]|uniref:Uncharacterized protein n=1 Tax=Promicromonospora umidemergens TaxID=629679 RepID=A0ABP8XW31_9MICO|nr:hypothetical protein [Promicromonospora umidemergens]MCP2285178.1 hypothetical protein [Promicromonospora umidemergens]